MTVSKPTPEELGTILVEHAEWLREGGGERADLSYANLAGVVVPYHTDGKARCAKLTLLQCVKEAK